MEANEAPEKIYLNQDDGLIWHCRSYKDDIEYIRTDVIIEKALKFLDGCIPDYIDLKHANVDTFMSVDNERFINDFKNHLKGD